MPTRSAWGAEVPDALFIIQDIIHLAGGGASDNFARPVPGRAGTGRALHPVWPKPPEPRSVTSREAASSSSAITTGAITSCPIRSPGSTT